jgi:hypothetical protein
MEKIMDEIEGILAKKAAEAPKVAPAPAPEPAPAPVKKKR